MNNSTTTPAKQCVRAEAPTVTSETTEATTTEETTTKTTTTWTAENVEPKGGNG